MGVFKILERCSGDIWWVSWRLLMGLLVIFDRCPGEIWSVS